MTGGTWVRIGRVRRALRVSPTNERRYHYAVIIAERGLDDRIVKELRSGIIGLLRTPANGYSLRDVKIWAMDNGAFTKKYPGDDSYMKLLRRLEPHRARCLWVAAPDVVADAAATLELFPPMAARIRTAGWPVCLVAQDDMEHMPIPWDSLDALFIGGSTPWKLGPGAVALIREAKARGKLVHVGRVNSGRRFARFAALDCDTADGTFLAFGARANLPRLRGWMQAASHPRLW